jgi:hypothetical protein
VRQRFFQRKQLSAGIICRSAHDLAAVWLLYMQKSPRSNSGLVVISSKEPVETKKKLYLQFEIKIYVNFILDVNYLEKQHKNNY